MAQSAAAQSALFTDEHRQFEAALQSFIAREVNPFVDEWEAAGIFPPRTYSASLGRQVFLVRSSLSSSAALAWNIPTAC